MGALASTSTSPVLTSRVIANAESAPVFSTWAASRRSAMYCSSESSVSCTSTPFWAGVVELSPSGMRLPFGALS